MRLEHYPQAKLRREILEIVGNHLDLKTYRVFFFGSRVSGRGDDRSDIDVGIEGPKPVGWKEMMRIREAVDDLPTLYKIDVVDFSSAGQPFRENASRHREFITIQSV